MGPRSSSFERLKQFCISKCPERPERPERGQCPRRPERARVGGLRDLSSGPFPQRAWEGGAKLCSVRPAHLE
eukprot:212673-Alexandrium_andersonii.AAC.1